MKTSGNPVRSNLLKGSSIVLAAEAIVLGPGPKSSDSGTVTLQKENGLVKGFEYKCICGHKDYFVCE